MRSPPSVWGPLCAGEAYTWRWGAAPSPINARKLAENGSPPGRLLYFKSCSAKKGPHLKTLTLTLTAKEFGLAAHTPTIS